jgi:hypothetical protein
MGRRTSPRARQPPGPLLTSPFGDTVRMSEVTAVCLPDNAASRALLTDLLIPQDATVLEHRREGSAINVLCFSLTREQHEQRTAQRRALRHHRPEHPS